MLESICSGYEFEKKVCEILYKTNPYQLSHYDGGPDRGRDICIQYHNGDKVYDVIVECKFYNSGVNKDVIMSSLNWAKVHQPQLLYFWVVPYLTPSAKDYVQLFEKEYRISVLIEEKINIEEYLKYIYDDNAPIWSTLRNKILNSCLTNHCTTLYVPEYELDCSEKEPFLVDRKLEREKLFFQSQKAFFLQGMSACGKTQLLKYIAYVFVQKDIPVFWYTIRSGSIEQQCSDFFHTLARYFDSVHKNQTLLKYFESYGFFLCQDMENIVVSVLNKYNPVLFIDDVHNCRTENTSMRNLFTKLIKCQICRIYFSGWFNIFNFMPNERKCMLTIILEGLKKKELDLIIKHYSGEHNLEMAELIEQKFYGLPGYAILANNETTVNDINSADDFLSHFLTLLSYDEKIVLFTLSLLSSDVPSDFFRENGYSMQLISLDNKHLLVTRKCCYTVHDKYRDFFSQCTIEHSLMLHVISLINKYAALEPSAFLDLINYMISNGNYSSAWNIVVSNFQLLISCQFYTQLLSQLQNIEYNAKGEINFNDIVLKKIVLLERLGEYSICLQYIQLFDDMSLFDLSDQEMIFYIHLRCLYFTNKYDDILKLYKENYSTVENFTDRELYIQILLSVGRVFYIRGSSKGALIFYLLAYQNAQKLHKRSLEVKAIHRIAMIERRLGLVTDSRKAFQELLKLDKLITPKRRSYIFYRIAKCFFNEGDLEQAKEYNKKSIKIKESYNDIRGLIFSDTLNAMICLKGNDYLGAYFNSTRACEQSNSIGLHKEWLSAALVQFCAAEFEIKKGLNTRSNLELCLKYAIEDKLLIQLRKIEQVTKESFPDLCSIAQQSRKEIEKEISISEDMLIGHYFKKSSFSIQQDYESLILHKTAISHSLLIRSGFLDPLLLC